jgi:hypothetical protein
MAPCVPQAQTFSTQAGGHSRATGGSSERRTTTPSVVVPGGSALAALCEDPIFGRLQRLARQRTNRGIAGSAHFDPVVIAANI